MEIKMDVECGVNVRTVVDVTQFRSRFALHVTVPTWKPRQPPGHRGFRVGTVTAYGISWSSLVNLLFMHPTTSNNIGMTIDGVTV